MSEQPKALRMADWMQNAVHTYPQMSEDEPGGYYTEVDQVMDEAAAELRRLHALCEEIGEALEIADGTLAIDGYTPERPTRAKTLAALAKWKESK